MLRPYLGTIGHFSVLLAFIAALVSVYFYSRSFKKTTLLVAARWAFYVHALSVLTVVMALFTIIFNHYFEYHYAWDNTSVSLPLGYAISCFWQDQEGSFLLWMFWNVVIGFILIKLHKKDEPGIMLVFVLVQAFLTSMILGVVFFDELKVGSSPFLLLKEARPDFPIFQSQPNYIPKDGLGLNPLLQNYWMVIHPPTLFLGFSLSQVPFAWVIGGLLNKNYQTFIKPALWWSAICIVILGAGIMMGAIWAYETLNFGGYWNWDPVENAVYVPWLVCVAALHLLLMATKSASAKYWAMVLVIAQFILILYSTFLTRSGILGNSSVHSFTDLGLSGQLLLYLLAFLGLSIGLLIYRRKDLATENKELSTYSKEFWIYLGAMVLCLTALQVIIPTSYPAFNSLGKAFGFNWNLATPSDQVTYYTQWQMWLYSGVAILTGIAQYFWWQNLTAKDWLKKLSNPLIITLLISGLCITILKINKWEYILVFTAAMFGIVANLSILSKAFTKKFSVSGGSFAHIGMALMILGVLGSEGFERVLSQNYMGYDVFSDKKENEQNVVLWLNKAHNMGDIDLTYGGQYVEVRGIAPYVPKDLIKIVDGIKAVAVKDFKQGEKTYFKKGDSLKVEVENTYYKVSGKFNSGKAFDLYPRFQENERMGNVFSPDIQKKWNGDVYTHVTVPAMHDDERQWSQPEEFSVALKDTFYINDFVAVLESLTPTKEVDNTTLGPDDAAVLATVKVLDKDTEVILKPVFIVKDNMVGKMADTNMQLGVKISLNSINPQTGMFTFGVSRTQREFIVIKAIEKPFINLLWLGTALLLLGGCISIFRRYKLTF